MAATSSPKVAHLYRSQKTLSTLDTKAISHSVLVDGTEHVVSYGGTSQYNRDGTGAAACGLAALNFARIAFFIEEGGLRDATLLQAVLARECAEETTAICGLWSGDLHLEVDDIYRVPLFKKTLKLKTIRYGFVGISEFRSLLMELNNLNSSAAAIITRPPEILACLKLRLTTRNIFIIFDSHPRPSYPNGAGMTVSSSIEGTARRLSELLPTVDLSDSSLQWQALLLSNYSAHVFIPHGVKIFPPTLWQAVVESSVAQLSTRAEIADLRLQNQYMKTVQHSLENEIKEVEGRNRRQERLIADLAQQVALSKRNHKHSHPSTPLTEASPTTHRSFSPSSSKTATSPSADVMPGGYIDKPVPLNPPIDHDDDLLYAIGLQHEFEAEDNALFSQRTSFSPLSSKTATSPSADVMPGGFTDKPLPLNLPIDQDDDLLYAMGLQHEFEVEDNTLFSQHAELVGSSQPEFTCDICMEEMPVDSIACPDPCGHTFCRDCLRGHVTARLDEHRFPILCPTCTADKDKGKGSVGEVSQSLALDLGLTDEQYKVWTEMEMVSFSVILHCRKCERSMFVARDEHDEVNIVICPLPDCDHAWCKQCQQSIDPDGPNHSCDGTSELDHLMKEKGWKYCPSCKTPIQKESGCNHMSCMTPACNTHFCYTCGDLIVKSALGSEIDEAVSDHFRKDCSLFAVPT